MAFKIFIAAGTALFFFGEHVMAESAQNRSASRPAEIPSSAVVTPDSSIAKSTGFAHTNVKFIRPATIRASSAWVANPSASPLVGPPYAGYGYETPGSLACLYGLVTSTPGCSPNAATAVPSTKGSKAIAIVDAYHYSTALADLQAFSAQFGLPAPNLAVRYATADGGCSGPKPAPNLGWAIEQALDIQMAHALAPVATIFLVEAQSNSYQDMIGAVICGNRLLAGGGGGEMSLSWGGSETDAFESAFRTTYNIVYFASSGDSPGVSWPSTSPRVVSVGGATISRALPSFNFQHYASWADAGEGPSKKFPLPSYQSGVPGITGAMRVTPDISAVANPTTGVWVFFNDANFPSDSGWFVVGGTSAAAPLIAAITNAAGTFRKSSAAELKALYDMKKAHPTGAFATSTIGYCGPYAAYVPTTEWNFCLGVGTVKGSVTPLVAAQ
jgi:subtilase family serine protease